MKVTPIHTRKMMPPQDDMWELLEESMPKTLAEKSVVAVTSKIVAIHQGRCIPIVEGGVERDELAHIEAERYAPRDIVPGSHILFTIKHNTLIASGGIDMSNANEHMVLWPNKPGEVARDIHGWLWKKYRVKEVGVIITDSHVVMMRTGVVGVSIGHFGFNPVKPYMGDADIFGRILQYERTNVADALAAVAVFEMGEGIEQTPLAIITDPKHVVFSEDETVNKGIPPFRIPADEDLFEPMLSAVPWKKGKGGLSEKQLAQLRKTGTWEEEA